MSTILTNQQALYDFLSQKLSENSFNVEFRTDLFNTQRTKYWYYDDNGNKNRFVPTLISDVIGEYINVPNANSTNNTVGISFDMFVGTQDNSDKATNEYDSVSYANTVNAIEEFKNSLLAQYFPLGDAILYMGGEDSTAEFTLGTTISPTHIKLNLIPLNDDNETEDILTNDTGDFRVYKFYEILDEQSYIKVSLDNGVALLEVPYTVGIENKIEIIKGDTEWTLQNVTTGDLDTVSSTFTLSDSKYILGNENGLEAKISRIRMGVDSDYEQVDINTWNSDSEITNSGEAVISSSSISNCILWCEDGNAIFGFGTLNPVDNPEVRDGNAIYQTFELEMNVFISNDVLFGNNFKYYLDDIQIYPIDRSHSLATEIGASQYINSNENEYMVEESARDFTMSFYYIPSKKLTKLLKRVASGDTSQNNTYSLVVQYPFFQVTYDALIDSGGTNPNINTLSDFTLTFKKADRHLGD